MSLSANPSCHCIVGCRLYRGTSLIKTNPPPRTLQEDHAEGPGIVPGGGRFLMSEVPLKASGSTFVGVKGVRVGVKG